MLKMLLKFLLIATIFITLVYTQLHEDDRMSLMDRMRNATHLMDRLQRTTTEGIGTDELMLGF